MKVLIFIKRRALLVQTCSDGRSDFHAKVQDMSTYQHRLCMKKRRVFNASIKCSNNLK